MGSCELGLTLLGEVACLTVTSKSHSISVRRRVSVLSVEFKLKTKAQNTVLTVLLASVLLFFSGPSIAQLEADPELAKYIEVLVKMRNGILNDLKEKSGEKRPTDESLADQLKHLQDMSELLGAVEDINGYIKQIKKEGMPGSD